MQEIRTTGDFTPKPDMNLEQIAKESRDLYDIMKSNQYADVEGKIFQAGVYSGFYIPKEVLEEFVKYVNRNPVPIRLDHVVDDKDALPNPDETVGFIDNMYMQDDSVYGSGVVIQSLAKYLTDDTSYYPSVHLSYSDVESIEGVYNDNQYKQKVNTLSIEHVSLVDNPRITTAKLVAKFAENSQYAYCDYKAIALKFSFNQSKDNMQEIEKEQIKSAVDESEVDNKEIDSNNELMTKLEKIMYRLDEIEKRFLNDEVEAKGQEDVNKEEQMACENKPVDEMATDADNKEEMKEEEQKEDMVSEEEIEDDNDTVNVDNSFIKALASEVIEGLKEEFGKKFSLQRKSNKIRNLVYNKNLKFSKPQPLESKCNDKNVQIKNEEDEKFKNLENKLVSLIS